jgi:TP901 family phage tail tape measure protein
LNDSLQLGISLQLDTASLNQLNLITKAVQNAQSKINNIAANFNQVTQSVQKVQQTAQQLSQSMVQISQRINDIRNSGQKLVNVQENMNQKGKIIVETYKNLDGTLSKIKTQYDTQNNIVNQSLKIQQGLKNAIHNIGTTIVHNTKKMLEWATSGMLIYGSLNLISKAFKTIVDTESELVNIRKVLLDNTDFRPIAEGAKIISQQFGVALTDTLKAAQTWARQYKDVNDVVTMTNVSMKAAAVTDITLESSYKLLSAAVKQFKMSVADSNHVIDVWNELSNNMRTSAEDLSQGMAKTGSAAKLMGIDFDRTAAIIGTLVEVTGASGEEMGTVVNRAFSRVHTKGAIEQLKALNINGFQPLSKTLDELGLKWNEYSAGEQEAVAKSLGGTHHWQKIMALFSNYPRVIEATLIAYDSFGSANREIELAMSTFNKKVEQLQAAFQSLSVSVGTGLLPVIKNMVDGFRIIISVGDGIIPKLGILTGVVWGVVVVFKAWQAASFAVSTTGIVGIIAGLVTLGSIIIGATSSTNKLVEATNRLSQAEKNISYNQERGRQINYLSDMHQKLYEKLQKLDKGTKEYNETLTLYKKIQSQVNQLGNEFGVIQDKTLSKYEGERNQINLLIDKIAELDKKRQQAYENELKRQVKDIKPQVDQLQGLMELKSQYYQAQNRRQTIDTPGTINYKITEKVIGDLRDKIHSWITNNSNMSSTEIASNNLSAKVNMTGWLKEQQAKFEELSRTLMDLERKRLGVNLVQASADFDFDEETTKPLKDTATITEFNRQFLEMIIGSAKKYDEYVNKTISDPERKLKPQDMLIAYPGVNKMESIQADVSSYSYNKYQSEAGKLKNIMDDLAKIGDNLDDIQRPYEEAKLKAERLGKTFIGSEQDISARQQVSHALDSQSEKLNDWISQLQLLSVIFNDNELVINALKEAEAKRLEILKLSEKYTSVLSNEEGKKNVEPMSEKKQSLITRSISELSNILGSLGENANIASTFLNNMSENLENIFSTEGFNRMQGWSQTIEGFGLDILFKGIANFISQVSQAFTDMNATPSSQYNRDKEDGFNLSTSLKGYRDFEKNKNKLDDLTRARGDLELKLALSGGVPGASAIFQTLIDKINKQIKDVEKTLENTIGAIKELLGTSIDDIAGSLQNALGATNYMDFLKGWNQNLYQMTRDALIKGFLASSTVEPLMKGLSDVITNSVIDGVLTTSEIGDIKTASNALTPLFNTLYSSLGMLDQQFNMGGNDSSGGGGGNYVAGTNQPIIYNNYISLHAGAFTGDHSTAQTFLYWIRDGLQDIEGRA